MIISKVFRTSEMRPAKYKAGSTLALMLNTHRMDGIIGIADAKPMILVKMLGDELSIDVDAPFWDNRDYIKDQLFDKYPTIKDWIGESSVTFNASLEVIGGKNDNKMSNMDRHYSLDQLNKYVVGPACEAGARGVFPGEVWTPSQAVSNLIAVTTEDDDRKVIFYPCDGDKPYGAPVYASEHSLPHIAASLLPNPYTIATTPPEYVLAEFFLSMKLVSPYVFEHLRKLDYRMHHMEKIVDYCREVQRGY